MSIVNQIPLEYAEWNRNRQGYAKHQAFLVSFAEYLEEDGFDISLPASGDGWDKGVDIYIKDRAIDLKSFGLSAGPKSFTWDSPYWSGKEAPTSWKGSLTDYYVHADDGPISEWKIAKAKDLRTSKFRHGAPFYWRSSVHTLNKFLCNLK